MEWSLEAIASSLQLEFEEGYDDRYTFTLTNNKLSIDDLHLMVNVCTIEPYGEGYILHPHGTGRLMTRADAKNSISMKDYKEAMKGIFTSCVSSATIDESPMAYKPMEEIIANIEPTCCIEKIIKPFL